MIKYLRDTYKTMVQGTDLLYECKEKHITKSDLDDFVYPDISEKFFSLEQKGQEFMSNMSLSKTISQYLASGLHFLLHHKKIAEVQIYARENIFNSCRLKDKK